MIFDNLLDSKVLILLGISLFLFALGALRSRKDSSRSDLVSSKQTAGFIFWQALDRWVNYALYPVIIMRFGLFRGAAIMTVGTFIQNMVYVWVNSVTEEDWTFMGWFTYLRDSDSHVWPLRYYRVLRSLQIQTFRNSMVRVLWVFRRVFRIRIRSFDPSKIIGFIYLSAWKDSFYAVNFLFGKAADLRRGKVMTLFIVSHIICNVVWAPIAGVIGEVAQYILHLFSSF